VKFDISLRVAAGIRNLLACPILLLNTQQEHLSKPAVWFEFFYVVCIRRVSIVTMLSYQKYSVFNQLHSMRKAATCLLSLFVVLPKTPCHSLVTSCTSQRLIVSFPSPSYPPVMYYSALSARCNCESSTTPTAPATLILGHSLQPRLAHHRHTIPCVFQAPHYRLFRAFPSPKCTEPTPQPPR
jgi:hypothetical protein